MKITKQELEKEIKVGECMLHIAAAKEFTINTILDIIEGIQTQGGYLSTTTAKKIVKDNKKKDMQELIEKAGGKETFIDKEILIVTLHNMINAIKAQYQPEDTHEDAN